VRPHLVVFPLPGFNHELHFLQRQKSVHWLRADLVNQHLGKSWLAIGFI
jgi:hypothetical protein